MNGAANIGNVANRIAMAIMAAGLAWCLFGFIAPGSAQSAPDSTAVVVYTVQPGDTLWRYAASITPEGGNVGDTVDELMRLNTLIRCLCMRGSASLFPMRRRDRQAWLISRAQSILDNMHCPFCQNPDTKVVDTRISDDGHSIRRRRECPKCSKRFTTLETTMLLVVKRSGNVEQFDRNKVISGVRKACQGRPINEDDLKMLGQKVEEDLRSRGLAQVKSDEVGKAILKPLRDLDMVAYMRFASVYQNFENLEDFQRAIDELKGASSE